MQRIRRSLSRFRERTIKLLGSLRRWIIPFCITLVAAIVLILLFSPLLSVRSIKVARTDSRLDPALIERALRPLFHRHLFFVAAYEVRPLLLATLPDVERSAVPDLAEITVQKNYPSALTVKLELQPIVYRLQIQEPGAKTTTATGTGGMIDFLTRSGLYVTYPAAEVASGAQLPLLTIVDWGVRPTPWKPLISPAILEAIERSEFLLQNDLNIPVKGRSVMLRAREFHLQTDRVSLWFDARSTVEEQIERLNVYRRIAPLQAQKYIDLRLKDKVIYR